MTRVNPNIQPNAIAESMADHLIDMAALGMGSDPDLKLAGYTPAAIKKFGALARDIVRRRVARLTGTRRDMSQSFPPPSVIFSASGSPSLPLRKNLQGFLRSELHASKALESKLATNIKRLKAGLEE